jgi:type IV pilus assembly protein PilP
MTITLLSMSVSIALGCTLAQIPNPAAATGAAREARTQTEAAQRKNADALAAPAPQSAPAQPGAPGGQPPKPAEQPPAPGAQPPAPGAPASAEAPAGTQPPAPPPPQGAGYTYDPAGRRDPFVSLVGGVEMTANPGARPAGVPGLLVNEVTVKGVWKSSRGGFIALVQAPDNRTYTIKAGDKLFDGSVKAITEDAVVFSQDVNDPLSLVKQREVRKAIRPEAR